MHRHELAQNRAELWHLLLAVPNQRRAAGWLVCSFVCLLRFAPLPQAIYYVRFSTQALSETKS
jgi:hypothetical protein